MAAPSSATPPAAEPPTPAAAGPAAAHRAPNLASEAEIMQAEAAARAALATGDGAPGQALLLRALSLPASAVAAAAAAGAPAASAVIFAPFGGARPAFVSAPQFAHNWRVFTLDQLAALDWRNVVAAGGAVLACATTRPAPPATQKARDAAARATRQLTCRAPVRGLDAALLASPAFLAFHGRDTPGELQTADIDLWLYDMSAEEAAAKVAHIGAVLSAAAAARGGGRVLAARTKHTTTFFSAFPFRCVQVIRAVFPSAAAPLLNFDLACCGICYGGGADGVSALPSCVAAVAARHNAMRTDIDPRGRSLARAYKYAARGVGLALPRTLPAPVTASAADDVFSAAKLAALLRAGAPVTKPALLTWRGDGYAAGLFPQQTTEEPPQPWVAGVYYRSQHGFQVGAPEDPRGPTYAAGIVQEDDAYEEERLFTPDEESDIAAQCGLVAALYPSPSRRADAAPLPDFPHALERPSDYGAGEPDISYGPPEPSDDGRGALPPLDLEEFDVLEESLGRAPAPRRAPVSAEETAALLSARAREGVRVAATPEALPALLVALGAFKPAVFADARAAAGGGGGAARRVRIAVQTAALPPLPLRGVRAAPVEARTEAFGASWRVRAASGARGAWLIVRLSLETPPPADLLTLPSPHAAAALGGGDSAAEAIDVDALAAAPPQQAAPPAAPRLLPVNILLQVGAGAAAFSLDSHAVFGVSGGGALAAPRSWCHVIYADKLGGGDTDKRGGGGGGGGAVPPLRVTLQAVRTNGA